jgi:hypothetical protein
MAPEQLTVWVFMVFLCLLHLWLANLAVLLWALAWRWRLAKDRKRGTQ